MPITGTKAVWAAAVVANLQTLNPEITGAAETALKDAWEQIADAHITHITGLSLVLVTSVTGVTPGPGVSGPGTGTIT